MIGCIKVPHGHILGSVRAGLRVTACAVLLAGCSSVPDAVNPVEWYKGASDFVTGKDKPEVAKASSETKTDAKAEPKKEPAKGLVADRGNAQYAEAVRREVTPTKQLAKRQAPAAETTTQVAQATDTNKTAQAADSKPVTDGSVTTPRPAPKTVASAELAPPPAAAQKQQVAQAPVALDNNPPARPDIPETVAAPKVKPVQAHYQKRLAESAEGVVRPGLVDAGFGPQLAAVGADEPIHLVPPSSRKKSGGGKGMAAPAPEAPAASFQVAALDFRGGSAELTAADREAIAQTAKMYRQSGGGVVRIVGLAPSYSDDSLNQVMSGFDASLKRANAVARELTKRGVPAGKIMVGADPAAGAAENVGAKVFLDVI